VHSTPNTWLPLSASRTNTQHTEEGQFSEGVHQHQVHAPDQKCCTHSLAGDVHLLPEQHHLRQHAPLPVATTQNRYDLVSLYQAAHSLTKLDTPSRYQRRQQQLALLVIKKSLQSCVVVRALVGLFCVSVELRNDRKNSRIRRRSAEELILEALPP